MEENFEQPQVPQTTNPQNGELDKLYSVVSQAGLYTKSKDEFKTKYSTPESIDKLYSVASQAGLYTKSKDDFYSKYYPDLGKKVSAQNPILTQDLSFKNLSKVLPTGGKPVEDVSEIDNISSSIKKGQLQGKIANTIPLGRVPNAEELGKIAEYQKELQSIPASENEQAFQNEGLAIFKNPVKGAKFLAETISSSLSSLFESGKRTVPAAVGIGAVAGAPFAGIGAIAGAGTGLTAGLTTAGYNISTSQKLLELLQDEGIDVTDKNSLVKAFSDENKMAALRSKANKYAIPIALFDVASAGIGGKLIGGAAGKSIAKKALAGLGEAAIQSFGGMGGELSGQLASGQKVDWNEVAIEGISSLATDAPDVAIGSIRERAKASSNNKTIARQVATLGKEAGIEDATHNLNRDLANGIISEEEHAQGLEFAQKAAEVSSKIPDTVLPENKATSIELIINREQTKAEIEQLEVEKQQVDEAYHSELDEAIKAKQQQVENINKEILGLSKSVTVIKPEENKPIETIGIGGIENKPETNKSGVSVILPTQNKKPEIVENKKVEILNPTEVEKPTTETVSEVKPTTEEGKASEKVKVYHGGGVETVEQLTEGQPLFVSESESQAKSYASGNEGKVKSFDIDKSKIAGEKEAREVIAELGLSSKEEGWNNDELNLHELIDPRFDTSLKEEDIKEVFKELEKRGYEGVEFTDTNLETQREDINNIAIFDPKKLFNKEQPKIETPIKEEVKGFTAKEGNKVVDEKGEPLVVYHGTGTDFKELDESKQNSTTGHGDFGKGFYFSADKGIAKYYSLKFKDRIVKSFNINIKNPFEINIKNEVFDNKTKEALSKLKYIQDYERDIIKSAINGDVDFGYKKITKEIGDKRFSDILKDNGYDGVFVNRTLGEETIPKSEIVVFDKSQIKEYSEPNKEQAKIIESKENKGGKEQKEVVKEQPKEQVKPIESKPTDEFISKNGKHKIVYDEKGNPKVLDVKTGKEASSYMTKKVINEKADSFDYSKGKRVEQEDVEGIEFKNNDEANMHVVENSENPVQIAEVYAMEKPVGKKLSTVEQMIAEFGIGRVTSSSWKRFGDRNLTGMSLAKSYLDGKRAKGIDVTAKEMSDHYDVEITPQDIVDFMVKFPNGEQSAFKLTESEVTRVAKERFEKLTGLPLNSETATKAINYEFNKLNEAQKRFAEQQFATEAELEEAYWREHKSTNGFTKESPSVEVKQTEAEVKVEEPKKEAEAKPSKAKELAAKLRGVANEIKENGVLPDYLKATLPDGTKQAGLSEKGINDTIAKALDKLADVLEKTDDIKAAIEEAWNVVKDYYDKNTLRYNEQKVRNEFDNVVKRFTGEDKAQQKPPAPPKPPKVDNTFMKEGSKKERQFGLKEHLISANEIPKSFKEGIKESGLEYEVSDQAEAASVARGMIKTLGRNDALEAARTNMVDPSVGSAIFAESLNEVWQQERDLRKSGDIEGANKLAEEWVDITDEYAKISNSGGKWNAQIGYFYKTSPMGVVMRIKKGRTEEFVEWFKNKEEGYREVFDEIIKSEEGTTLIKEEVEKARKEERKEARKKVEKKIDDFFDSVLLKGGGTYAVPIPPNVWNAVVNGMREGTKAGYKVADIVANAISDISKSIGEEWDKEAFRKEYEEKLGVVVDGNIKKEKTSLNSLESRKKELQRRIDEKDFSAEEYKEKKTLSEKEKQAKEDYDKVKEAYDEAKKQSPEYKEKKAKQYIEQFRKKLKGLDEKQKEEVIRRSVKKLIDNKALEYEDFKNIIADVIGVQELTKEEIDKIESLTNDINALEGVEKQMVENPTAENISKYEEAKNKSIVSGMELYNITHKESDITSSLKSMLTGSLLSVFSLIKNPVQNLVFQGQMRFPKAIVKQALDFSIYSRFGVKQSSDIVKAQKGYFKNFGGGVKKAIFGFKTGTQEQDLFSKYAYRSTLAPKEAIKDLKLWKEGKKFLTTEEVWDRRLRATWAARQADFILRAMAVGDLPQRIAAEGASAVQIGVKELGISDDNTMKAFILSPNKMAYKILLEQGKSKKEAFELADEIQKRIQSDGAKAVFQEENILSKASDVVEKSLKKSNKDNVATGSLKSLASLTKTATFPFLKIPANVAWASFKAINPEFSIMQGMVQMGLSQKAYNAGKFGEAEMYMNQSKDSFAHAVVGYGLSIAAAAIVAGGLVRPSNEKDTKAKESAGEKVFGRQNQVNIGGLMGMDDYWVDLSWFGPLGAMLDVKAQMTQDEKQRGVDGETQSHIEEILDKLAYSAKASLNQLVFDQGAKTIDAVMGGQSPAKAWGINMLNNMSNVITGASYAAISKNTLTEQSRLKGDNLLEEINNNQKQRNIIYRTALNLYKPNSGNPPARISIWGEPIKNDRTVSGVVGNLLGFEKGSEDKFGAIIYDDAQRTGNMDFFPPTIQNKLSVGGKDIKLSMAELDELSKIVGSNRKKLVAPFVNGSAVVPVYGKKYNELKDAEKLQSLKWIYEQAQKAGLEQFKQNNPKFKHIKTIEEKREKRSDKIKSFYFKRALGK